MNRISLFDLYFACICHARANVNAQSHLERTRVIGFGFSLGKSCKHCQFVSHCQLYNQQLAIIRLSSFKI